MAHRPGMSVFTAVQAEGEAKLEQLGRMDVKERHTVSAQDGLRSILDVMIMNAFPDEPEQLFCSISSAIISSPLRTLSWQ